MTSKDLPETKMQSASPPLRNRKLRIFAIPILVITLVEAQLGSSLMFGSLTVWKAIPHIVVALIMVEMTVHAFIISLRLPGFRHKAAAGLTMASTIGATIAGIVFLFGGQNPIALSVMEGLAGVILLGAILLLVWGSVNVVKPLSSRT